MTRVALVTGGGKGIGRSVSETLARAGITVVINYSRSEAEAADTAQAIVNAGGKAETLRFDVGNNDEVESAVKGIAERHGRCDILVSNAGIAIDGLLLRTKATDWERTLSVNLSGAFYCAKAVSKLMVKERWGRVVTIGSVIGEMGNAGQVAYSASKAGLIGLTKSLAKELASRNVTANCVTPGYIITDMTSGLSEDLRDSILSGVPLGRLGTAEDVSALVGFLVSDAASYITGQVIGVNGGMRM